MFDLCCVFLSDVFELHNLGSLGGGHVSLHQLYVTCQYVPVVLHCEALWTGLYRVLSRVYELLKAKLCHTVPTDWLVTYKRQASGRKRDSDTDCDVRLWLFPGAVQTDTDPVHTKPETGSLSRKYSCSSIPSFSHPCCWKCAWFCSRESSGQNTIKIMGQYLIYDCIIYISVCYIILNCIKWCFWY